MKYYSPRVLGGIEMIADENGQWAKRRDFAELEAELALAVKYLKEGKKRFTPNTTNSDVDVFIQRYDAKESE